MKKINRQIATILVGGIAFAIVIGIWEYQKFYNPITSLERGSYEETEYQERLLAKNKQGEETEVTIPVPQQEYTQGEITEMFEAVNQSLDTIILNDNQSFEEIRGNLNLPTKLAEWPVQIVWQSNRPEIIDWQGRMGEVISEEGEVVQLTAKVSYQEEEKEKRWTIKVFPPQLSYEEQRKQKLNEAVVAENNNKNSKIYQLPTELDGERISWFRPKSSNIPLIIAITIMLVAVLLVGNKREEVKSMHARKMQMQIDYPEILSKLILLMNAGMSMRMSFAKLASDYKKQKDMSKQKQYCRYAYEEFLTTYQEMEHGVLEVKAYERLGSRCGLAMYKMFSVLLIQNLRKGNQKLLEEMEREMASAFEERKRRAKILGEQISTKLLLPMMMMLMIVFVLLMVPAFLSF